MSDEEDAADPTRTSSRRDRFKGAVARTRTKLTKKNKETATTVDDFLASGAASTSTGRPSVSDSFSFVSDRPSTSQSHHDESHEILRPTTDPVPPPQPSPRRIVVPKIDVSTSQRYPAAQQIEAHNNDHAAPTHLRPEYQGRLPSTSSLAKGRRRARGLSVQFTDRPPIVIGEGGDEAEIPPIEVGRAKARARSVSPPRTSATQGNSGGRIWNRSPLPYLPRSGTASPQQVPPSLQRPPPPPAPGTQDSGGIPSPGLKRVQTGMIGATPSPISESKQAMDKEFEMSMGISSAHTNTPSSTVSTAEGPTILAPKPIRPPVAVPNVAEIPEPHELKREHGTKSLRNKFVVGEGDALRSARQDQSPIHPPGGSDEDFSPPPGPPPGKQPSRHGPLPPTTQYQGQGFAPPQHPPPGWRQPVQGNPQSQHPPTHRRPPDEELFPPPGPPPERRPVGAPFAPPPAPPAGPPPAPPPPTRNPDDDYMGWVADKPPNAPAHSFPGVDSAGKLAPFPGLDEDQEAKPEKHKKRWFRRGS
ncbi:uncharacterized protein HMPREF1541_01709 [Cyphellophora europaea CBS 101466]|uniref:Uncharacterized protein n=1 Tax=Cyphellophora europaea (strain CBS 101466) TaxID=1220924 RepID=W2S1J6_CYPE1|nr:uncharacterized protein HMPREF1541_01709 [Cyphellophora europaea CBS 101466]ETN42552.1 hypothetical protein HMPREF1541_01709 [Cyphellophora europaea CBS 101466]